MVAIIGKIIITGIKKNSILLKLYLMKCKSIYIDMPGWNGMDNNLDNFLYLIELYLGKKITYLGYGEDRSMKLERRSL